MKIKITLLLIFGFHLISFSQEKSTYDVTEELRDPDNLKGAVKELNYMVHRLDTLGRISYLSQQTRWRFDQQRKVLGKVYYEDTFYSQPARVYTVDETYTYKNGQLIKINVVCQRQNFKDSTLYYYDKNSSLQKIQYAKRVTHVIEKENTRRELDSAFRFGAMQTLTREYTRVNGKFRLTKEVPGDEKYTIQRTYSYVKDKKVKETFSHKGGTDYTFVMITVYDKKSRKLRDSLITYSSYETEIPNTARHSRTASPDEVQVPEYAERKKTQTKTVQVQSYFYDSKGNATSIKVWDQDINKETSRQEITYDDKGNWTEITVYFMGRYLERYTREISYF